MREAPPMTKEEPIRSYGRVKGRALKPRQARLMETLLPEIEIPAEGPIEPDALFSNLGVPLASGGAGREARESDASRPEFSPSPTAAPLKGGKVALEIGFGGGEHLIAQAKAHPEQRFLGVEPFLNGVASCLRHIEEAGVGNVRLRQGDARDLLARLPDARLDRVYILFPDPWPKKRHWKRRLIQANFIVELARAVKPGGEVLFVTDWKNYAAWTLAAFTRNQSFCWTAQRAADWRNPWRGHFHTRYEEKKLGDSSPIFLKFRRLTEN
jgi:tRNA (guanine-N7-)-methyltransferase